MSACERQQLSIVLRARTCSLFQLPLTASVGRLAHSARSLRRPPLTFFQSRQRSFNDLFKSLQINSKIVKNIVKDFVLVNYTL